VLLSANIFDSITYGYPPDIDRKLDMSDSNIWEEFRYSSMDDLKLAGRKYGWKHSTRPVVVCLPGLTRNSADFHELAVYLSQNASRPHRVLCLDYRGRGSSSYDKNWKNYNPLTEAGDVVDGMTAAGVEEATIIGTSRGGLIAMIMAATKPGLLHAVVLNDVGPEIDGKGVVRIKSYMERSKPPANVEQAIDNLKTYSSAQFPKLSDEDWRKQVELIYEQGNGKLIARYDPKLINTMKAIDLDAPLPTMWPQFAGLKNIPLLVFRGENSDLDRKSVV